MTYQIISLPKNESMWGDRRYDAFGHRVTFTLLTQDQSDFSYMFKLGNEKQQLQEMRLKITQELFEYLDTGDFKFSWPTELSKSLAVYSRDLDWLIIAKLKENEWLLNQIILVESRDSA